jgi:hypothetical protein
MLVLYVSVTDQLIPGARVLISRLLSLVLDNPSIDAVKHQDHALLAFKSTPSQVRHYINYNVQVNSSFRITAICIAISCGAGTCED